MPLPNILGPARVVADPELRWTKSGKAVLQVRLAFNESRFNQETQSWETLKSFFVDGSAWEKTAERLAEIIQKGDQVYVDGRLETQSWEQDGQTRSKPHVIIRNLQKFAKQGQQPSSPLPWGQTQPQPQSQSQQPPTGQANRPNSQFGNMQQQWNNTGQQTQADPWSGGDQGDEPPF